MHSIKWLEIEIVTYKEITKCRSPIPSNYFDNGNYSFNLYYSHSNFYKFWVNLLIVYCFLSPKKIIGIFGTTHVSLVFHSKFVTMLIKCTCNYENFRGISLAYKYIKLFLPKQIIQRNWNIYMHIYIAKCLVMLRSVKLKSVPWIIFL